MEEAEGGEVMGGDKTITTIEMMDVYEDLDGQRQTETRTISPEEYDQADPFFASYIVNQGGMLESHDVVFIMEDGSRWKVETSGGGLGAKHPYTAKLVCIEESDKKELPEITTAIVEKFKWPTDKVNGTVWKLIEGVSGGKIDVAHKDPNKPESKQPKIPVTYSIDFSGLEGLTISKHLEPYDWRVYMATAALFNGGYDIVTLQQIYRQMGDEGDAGSGAKQKISDSLTKMGKAWITIDNIREHQHYDKREHFRYKGPLLPIEVIEAVVNGNVTESAIHIMKEPALFTYAVITNQITTVYVKYLDSPLNKTNANIQLEDYLIYRISRMKRKGSKQSNKIRFERIYENTGITSKMQRKRATEKIKKLLKHYQQSGFIESYKIVSDGVEIFYQQEQG